MIFLPSCTPARVCRAEISFDFRRKTFCTDQTSYCSASPTSGTSFFRLILNRFSGSQLRRQSKADRDLRIWPDLRRNRLPWVEQFFESFSWSKRSNTSWCHREFLKSNMITSLHNYQQFLKSWSLFEEAIIVELKVVFAFSQKNKKQKKPRESFRCNGNHIK